MLSVSIYGFSQSSCPYGTSYTFISNQTNDSFKVAFTYINPTGGQKSLEIIIKSGNTTITTKCVNAFANQSVQIKDTTVMMKNITPAPTISFVSHTNGTCGGAPCNGPSFIPLAVKIVSFDATTRGNSVMLNWQVAEEDIKSYVVERSFDGSNWSEIGSILPKNATYYSYSDNVDRSAYYRLKLLEEDGTFSYSQTAMVKMTEPKVNLSPNPVTDVLHLSSSTDYILYDLQGKQLLKGTGNSIQMDVPPGTYFLKIEDNVQTVIKQ